MNSFVDDSAFTVSFALDIKQVFDTLVLRRLFQTSDLRSRTMASSEETRQRLLEAAGKVFAEQGKDAPVRTILQKAGVKNIAAINYYFGDKDQLYEEVLRYAFNCHPQQIVPPDTP